MPTCLPQRTVTLLLWAALIAAPALFPVRAMAAQDNPLPPAAIVNDEGGPIDVRGAVTYTNAFFTLGTAAPMVILEDQAGFVDRNEGFLMPVASQTLGQITSDFYTSPFSYTISLPIQPQATLRDVDQDDVAEPGVMIYVVAYWTNIFGDPFLEERDLFGGGWSTAYASTRVSDAAATRREIVGGKLLVYAPDGEQGFPSSFGTDGFLFTADDPIVGLPAGYTVVDLDTEPFTFDRAQHPVIDLIEPAKAALVDLSALDYAAAFDALVDLLSREYAFTAYKNIDWEALRAEFRPRFEEADGRRDSLDYRRALRDFSFAIPDGHVSGPFVVEDFRLATSGGIGMAMRDVDDGRVIVNYVLDGGPAAEAGIELGAEVVAIDGVPIDPFVDDTVAYSAPFSTEHLARLQKLRYAVRSPLGTRQTVTFRNPGSAGAETVTLTSVAENDSFSSSSFNIGLDGFELPLDYSILDSGYGYVQIYSFSDNELLTVQLWERLMRTLKDENVPGLIVDMRQNGGGSGFLADQMAAYFFQEPLELGNTGWYAEDQDGFFFDPRTVERFYLPADDLRYNGAVAVLTGPNCSSACEFFTYDMTLEGRAAIVGQYPTAGMGGSVDAVLMPEDEFFQYTAGRGVDMNGDIHVEGKGVAPTIRVPVNEQSLFSAEDPILAAAVEYLDNLTAIDVIDGGPLAIGDVVSGRLMPGIRVRYTLALTAGDVIGLFLEDGTGRLDTVLRVYDRADNLLASNDDAAGRGTANSAIERLELPVDLTLIVEAGTYEDSAAGAYTLSIMPGEKVALAAEEDAATVEEAPPAADDTAAGAEEEPVPTDAEPSGTPVDDATPTSPLAAAEPTTPPAPDETTLAESATGPADAAMATVPEEAIPTAPPVVEGASVQTADVEPAPAADQTAAEANLVNTTAGASVAADAPADAAADDAPVPTTAESTPADTNAAGATAQAAAPAANTPISPGQDVVVRTFGARLSVRTGPGTEYDRIVYAINGSTHTVLEVSEDGAWLRITVPDSEEDATGWIAASYAQPLTTADE